MAQWKVNFDDLDLGERIGKGNFGEVYKGTYLGTDVAIKKLFFVDDDFMQKYIEREMDTLTGLSHPNIVQLMGLCIETDDMYIITEFITGGDLRSKLKDKSVEMDWKLRVEVLRDIALAMNYLHSKSIMHRDLKSHNLLVGENWKVKVCDFGLARSAPTEGEEANHLMTIVGTNEWMAPEVAMGESYDKSADVFSFGMVIYELITRDKPPMRKLKDCYAFNGDDHAGNIPSDTPPALWDLLLLCAARDPQDRPDFKKVVDSLKTILENLPAKAVKKSTDSGKKKSTKKAATADKEEDGEKKKKKKKKTTAESAEKEEDGEKKKKKKKKTTTEGAEKKEEDGEKKKKKKKKTTTEGADGEKKKKKSTKKDDENGEKKKKKSTKKAE
ncbi:protein kinase domain containing protein [Acanthamoeba castellanii str. Neff]|uniref:non-specific serine/threonine protein kinase n=1 Tax=Acanthamoeba castellanii (strain ATCC 30010 / Neff) TaxID=1257118 RepID=L8GPI7_ACACF|nr:protein kinase domain containing protein [Acanthamoeba castellanii str. Neff]ELR14036.1 protein kinase domain containing protein [Acanthamoeba castellanii str. Neff]